MLAKLKICLECFCIRWWWQHFLSRFQFWFINLVFVLLRKVKGSFGSYLVQLVCKRLEVSLHLICFYFQKVKPEPDRKLDVSWAFSHMSNLTRVLTVHTCNSLYSCNTNRIMQRHFIVFYAARYIFSCTTFCIPSLHTFTFITDSLSPGSVSSADFNWTLCVNTITIHLCRGTARHCQPPGKNQADLA